MRHQKQSELKRMRITIAISVIKELIEKDDIKKSIEICEKNKISAEQFGLITRYSDREPLEIYSLVF